MPVSSKFMFIYCALVRCVHYSYCLCQTDATTATLHCGRGHFSQSIPLPATTFITISVRGTVPQRAEAKEKEVREITFFCSFRVLRAVPKICLV